MKNLKLKVTKVIYIIFFLSISNNLSAKNFGKFEKTESISNYFSGILYLKENKYLDSYRYLKKLNGLENLHKNYAGSYQYSLVLLNRTEEAISYSNKLNKNNYKDFNSNLLIGISYLKKNNPEKASNYFKSLKHLSSGNGIEDLLALLLSFWTQADSLKDLDKSIQLLDNLPPQYENIKNIQKAFMHCYYNSRKTNYIFQKLIVNEKVDYSRYYFFYANFLKRNQKLNESKKVINAAILNSPENLLLNQFKEDLKEKNISLISNNFKCKNLQDIVAEIFYIVANALSAQRNYIFSNYYLSLAKYLNPNFISYDALIAENYFSVKQNTESLKIYSQIIKKGSFYKWYAAKQTSLVYLKQNKNKEAINFLKKTFNNIDYPKINEIFDYASFLRNQELYSEAIEYYSIVLRKIKKDHPLYPKVSDGRGISYERTNQWEKAEVDFLNSLEADSNQAYVINYLAYSWIEKGINIEKSLEMLKKANELKKNDGYIIDSLGWALFKLKKFKDAKKYLQLAVRIMPSDPVVNDHYGDALWMKGNKLQARYYWKYVLNLKNTEKELKEEIRKKLIFGKKI